MADIPEILSDLKQSLNRRFDGNVRDVILFGSQASGTSNPDSDYDILVLLSNKYSRKDENDIVDICYSIDLKYNILIDAHVMSVQELSTLRGKQPVFVNAIKSGIYA